jgi:hypothetical protein
MIFLPSRSASLTAALTSDSLWRMAPASSPPGSSSSHQPPAPPPFSPAAPAPAQPGSVVINGTVVVANHFGLSAPGKSTTLRLFSGTEVDHGE